ncbi:SufE family protein [Aestuariibacter salexigens]|uniref:SufE family protein n=1 Tax=Aestuariibacter salexigens TaxID=226010 RepID=UPI000411DECF|nr:SufE family protein [Aestuariibacter salexigens]
MSQISTQEILDDLEFFDNWEERYKYIIDLGKELTPMPESKRTPERLVKGCQSDVWLDVDKQDDKLIFHVDSDAIIVRGLLVLVMAAYNEKSAQQIVDFDIEGYFSQLDLERHISPTRGNGLRAIVAKIQALAKAGL